MAAILSHGQALDLLIQRKTLLARNLSRTADYEITLDEGGYLWVSTNGKPFTAWKLRGLLNLVDFRLKPEPDTAEKVLKEFLDWHDNIGQSTTKRLDSLYFRAKTLIAQMDGDK